MATPRPAKRRRTVSPELAAPIDTATMSATARGTEAGQAGATTNASSTSEEQQLEGEMQVHEITEEQLEEMTRIYDSIAEDYHDIVAELPLEYHRAFALMQELEEQQQQHTSSLRTTLEACISALPTSSLSTTNSAAPSPAASTSTSEEALPKIPPAAREKWVELWKHALGAIRAAEDKVGLAAGLYESVDRHIRRLDADLAKYEDSLVIGLREGTLPSHDAPAKGHKSPPGATTSRGAIALGEHEPYEKKEAGLSSGGVLHQDGEDDAEVSGGGEKARKTRKGMKGKTPAEVEKEREWKRRREVQKHERKEKKKEEKKQLEEEAAAGMPIDPNEPVYCFCRRVSFGEMIACENDDCPREWFHLDCVNLSEAPEGSWYCSECVKALNIDPKTMKPR